MIRTFLTLAATLAVMALAWNAPSDAQTLQPRVVQSCGAAQGYTPGYRNEITVDVNGTLCTSTGNGGSAASPTYTYDVSPLLAAVGQPIPSGSNNIGTVNAIPNDAKMDGPYVCSTSNSCAVNSQIGPNIDTTGFGGGAIEIQILSIASGSSVTEQASEDPVCTNVTHWGPNYITFFKNSATAYNSPTTTNNLAGMYIVPVLGHCVRFVANQYAAGDTISIQWGLRAATSSINGIVYVQQAPNPGLAQLENSATATHAVATATLAPPTGFATYLCGFTVSSAANASAVTGTVTVTGLLSTTDTYDFSALANTAGLLRITFPGACKKGVISTSVVVSITDLGAGVVAHVNAEGFYQ